MLVLLQGLAPSWRNMLTVASPIGDDGALLLPPLLIAAVTVAAATALARTRRPWCALIPLALGVAAISLLAAAAADHRVVAALAVSEVVGGLAWTSWQRSRKNAIVAPPGAKWQRPALTVGLLLTIGLVVAVVAGPVTTAPRLALRTTAAVPVDPSAFPSPLAAFRRSVGDDQRTAEFSVTGARAGDRLRLASLDSYDGQVFTASPAEGPFARIGLRQDPIVAGVRSTIEVSVKAAQGVYVPIVGELVSITFSGQGSQQLTDDFRYSAVASTALLPGGWAVGRSYVQIGEQPLTRSAAALAGSALAPVPFPTTPAIPDVLRAAATRFTVGANSPGSQLTALATGLAKAGYFSHGLPGQLVSPAGHGLNRLLTMVSNVSMVGDQEQYAALMAVLARSLGIPARVVVGYTVPTGSGAVVIHGSDLTAWVEAPFAGAGWVAFDPTPPQTRTHPQNTPQPHAGRHIADADPPPALAGANSATVQAGDSQKPQGQNAPPRQKSVAGPTPRPWWIWSLLAVAAFVVMMLAVVGAILAVKALVTRRRRRSGAPEARVRASWRAVLNTAVDSGFRPARGATRGEISGALLVARTVDSSVLASAADAADFSPTVVSVAQARQAWAAADRLSKELLQALPLKKRWRTRLSLASTVR